jgi:hypothetical protein
LLFGKFIELVQTTFTGFLIVFTHVDRGYTGIGWKNQAQKVNGKSSTARHTEMAAFSGGGSGSKWGDETSRLFLNSSRVAGRGGRKRTQNQSAE